MFQISLNLQIYNIILRWQIEQKEKEKFAVSEKCLYLCTRKSQSGCSKNHWRDGGVVDRGGLENR